MSIAVAGRHTDAMSTAARPISRDRLREKIDNGENFVLVDVTGLVIYFTIAFRVLRGTLL